MGTYSITRQHGRDLDALQGETFFREHGWTRVPRLVQWMATLRCPLSCPHCLAGDDHTEDLSLHHAARLIEQVAAMGVEEFLLTGGEPLARPDLPEIIDMLRANRVHWSLNTAQMPDRRTQAAMEKWPPGFVAVSVDGPEKVHDDFRGVPGTFRQAMQSIGFFAGMGVGVAAGTTVTARNFRYLSATFGIVLGSGATSWGLHLPVPEGRASYRKDLFLSRSQIKGLLDFVTSKRSHFPVTMADEIGYCGLWEPLLRDEPFFCGAGRAGCVVLPGGEVVPCTTLDRTTSAGNAMERPFREIWETGFKDLRGWVPKDKCSACPYVSACGGGCWLQRRHGTQCFQDVWHMPQALKTAAGLAVCLGIASSGATVFAQESVPPENVSVMAEAESAKMQILQSSIIRWYASQLSGRGVPNTDAVIEDLRKTRPDDPGAQYFLAFAAGKRPEAIEDRARSIINAFNTKQCSLCLVGLAWRDVTEWCLRGTRPEVRTDVERKALREVVAKVGETAEAWRTEIFENKLDPSLRQPLQYRRFFVSKAGPTALQRLEGNLAQERWRGGKDVTRQFLAEHPYAESLALDCTVREGANIRCLRGGQIVDVNRTFTLRAFDVLVVPKHEGDVPTTLEFSIGTYKLKAVLPPETELAYGDVLRIVHEQNPKIFAGELFNSTLVVSSRSPFALPELLIRMERWRNSKAAKAGEEERAEFPYEIIWRLFDLYLF